MGVEKREKKEKRAIVSAEIKVTATVLLCAHAVILLRSDSGILIIFAGLLSVVGRCLALATVVPCFCHKLI